MKHRVFSSALVIGMVFGLTGCDQMGGKFEIVRAGNQTFVLNKATGDTQLIEGQLLVKVQVRGDNAEDEVLKQVKSWPLLTISPIGDLKLSVKTKYRDGKMQYQIDLEPFQGRLEKEFNAAGLDFARQPIIFVDFYDEDEFRISDAIELKINGGGGTRVVNDKGEPYALVWRGSQAMSLEAYRAARKHSIRWSGFAKN